MAVPNPFAALPPISFTNTDVAALQQAVITGFQQAWKLSTGETLVLYPSDRRYNFLMSLVDYLINERELINQSALQNLLPYATGGFLDNLAILFNTLRLPAAAAVTTLEFTLPQTYPTSQTIPAGSQCQSSSTNVVFASDNDLIIPAGYISGLVTATCTTAANGVANGIPIGDITTLLNWTSSVFTPTVTNTQVPTGDAPVETDDVFRVRLLTATDSYSPAGPKNRYKFYAEKVSSAISDVSVMGPEDGLAPGNVLVTILLQNGVYPTPTFLSEVSSALNPDDVRDLCANVSVFAPTGVPFSVTVNYYVDESQANNVVNIQKSVQTAVTNWIYGNQTALGGAITPTSLISAVYGAGASYVDPASLLPASRIALNLNQIGILVDDPIVNYLGLEMDSQI
jgi:phage-related baseplate assembly protein